MIGVESANEVLYTFRNTAIFSALLTYAEEIKESPRGSRRANIALHKLDMGLFILEEMREYWTVLRWAWSLFSFLSERGFDILKRMPRPSRLPSPSLSHHDGPVEQEMEAIGDSSQPYFGDGLFQNLQQWYTDTGLTDNAPSDFNSFPFLTAYDGLG